MEKNKLSALEAIDVQQEKICKLSDFVWENPETAFKETESAEAICKALKDFGFEVETGITGIPTAFLGRFGQGKPVIGVLGEFDALSGLSQQSGACLKTPLNVGGAGHGCGHNLLGTGSLAAAVAVKEYLTKTKSSGTIVYFGCPGEEGGSGKAFMARDGAFDELDCAVTWHPFDVNTTSVGSSLANYQIAYKFTGVSAHAAACPHLGRSALDAVELMNVGVQFLREHVIPETRIHYAITNTGGYSPNVVQPVAEVLYLIRAPKTPQVQETYERVCKIAKGAAMMTDTELEIKFIKACSNIVPNTVIAKVLHKNLKEVELPSYTKEEQDYAESIIKTFESESDSLEAQAEKFGEEEASYIRSQNGKPINNFVVPMASSEAPMAGSTDVGDVSWVCPVAQISVATMAANTPGHSWQLTSQGKSSIAHKGMLYAGKVMAGAIIDLLNDPVAIQTAKEELNRRLKNKPFVSPIPKDVKPEAIGSKQ